MVILPESGSGFDLVMLLSQPELAEFNSSEARAQRGSFRQIFFLLVVVVLMTIVTYCVLVIFCVAFQPLDDSGMITSSHCVC